MLGFVIDRNYNIMIPKLQFYNIYNLLSFLLNNSSEQNLTKDILPMVLNTADSVKRKSILFKVIFLIYKKDC